MASSLSFTRPPSLPITPGATLPNPGAAGAAAWSTVIGELVIWNGTQWGALADVSHVHTQGVPSETWVVQHNLGKVPAITVIDSSGDEVRGDTRHDSINQATLTFAYPFSGSAHCN